MIKPTTHLLLICLLFLPLGCNRPSASKTGSTNSASSARYPNLKTQADELTQASLKGDDARAADLTYPKLIEVMGGREQYIENLKAVRGEMQSENFSILSASVEDPKDIVEVEKQIYAIVPMTMRMKAPEGILVGRSSLIGVSSDAGKNWTFVTANRELKGEALKVLFPAAADKLRLPESTEPVLERQSPTP